MRRADGELVARFTPALLRAHRYADGRPVLRDDYLHIRRHAGGDGVGRVYGRALEQADALWLQYWTWHTFNGWHYALGGWHFGDWECVILRIRDDVPDLAAYAQHSRCEVRPWRRVRRQDGRPLVIVRLGSHAAGFDRSVLGNGLRDAGVLPLEVIGDATHPWIDWPGRWGQSRAGGRCSDSPRGPAQHRQWNDPAGWVDAHAAPPA